MKLKTSNKVEEYYKTFLMCPHEGLLWVWGSDTPNDTMVTIMGSWHYYLLDTQRIN